MGIVEIIGIGIIATILSLTVGKQDATWSFYIRFATSLIIMFFIITQLSGIFDTASHLGEKANVGTPYIKIVFKIIGIAYISEFGSGLCKDAGESAIASKIEFAGKVMILATSAPVILALMDLITSMLG
ncbi:MAG TPA: stage III sporulation protein AD [Epulopiscium sp.]|nr:stage III sporulation protein AD [Candidatus Epulonipiscium sp.]